MKLSILVPIYNEENTLNEIIERVLKQKVDGIDSMEIVMIDDCSDDASVEVMKKLESQYPGQIKLGFHTENQGKGAAIRKAIEMATGDIAIIQDADLEYDPADYPSILRLLITGQAEVVFGSRFLLRQERRAIYFRHALGNKFITLLSNLFTDLYLTDVETCYKAFRLDLMKTVPLRSNRFGIEVELVAKIARRKFCIYEVPISYYGRTYAEGKKITWKDGVSALWTIAKYWVIDDSVK